MARVFLSSAKRVRSFRYLFPLLLLGLLGCGGKSGAPASVVTGKVTYNGNPLPGGTVTFYIQGDPNAVPASSIIQDDGTYRIVNVKPGTVKITVQGPGRSSTGDDKGPKVTLPPRYQKPDQSGLNYTVTDGNQVHPIDLTP